MKLYTGEPFLVTDIGFFVLAERLVLIAAAAQSVPLERHFITQPFFYPQGVPLERRWSLCHDATHKPSRWDENNNDP